MPRVNILLRKYIVWCAKLQPDFINILSGGSAMKKHIRTVTLKSLACFLSFTLIAGIFDFCVAPLNKVYALQAEGQTGTIKLTVQTKPNSFPWVYTYGTDDDAYLDIFYTDGTSWSGFIADPMMTMILKWVTITLAYGLMCQLNRFLI